MVKRRSERSRERESFDDWRLGLSGAILKRADLGGAHFEGADLSGAHLEGADLRGAHLEAADLSVSHLEGADLRGAHLEAADLSGSHLEGADLGGAHFEWGGYRGVRKCLKGGSDLEALEFKVAMATRQLAQAHGDALTQLPAGLGRPAHWPPPAPDED